MCGRVKRTKTGAARTQQSGTARAPLHTDSPLSRQHIDWSQTRRTAPPRSLSPSDSVKPVTSARHAQFSTQLAKAE